MAKYKDVDTHSIEDHDRAGRRPWLILGSRRLNNHYDYARLLYCVIVLFKHTRGPLPVRDMLEKLAKVDPALPAISSWRAFTKMRQRGWLVAGPERACYPRWTWQLGEPAHTWWASWGLRNRALNKAVAKQMDL